jgi:GNAT superfamily N-acetyltransferase
VPTAWRAGRHRGVGALTVRTLADGDVVAAAHLLAVRHLLHRVERRELDPAFEDASAAREEIESLLARPGSTAAVAVRDGDVCGFMVGTRRDDDIWGPNVWVEAGGHAVESAEDIRDLYAFLAELWAAEGRTAHTALVPATDAAGLDAWFRLGFGHQHVHAVVPTPALRDIPDAPGGVSIRPAERRDVDRLVQLDVLLPAFQATSPVFSGQPVPTLAEAAVEYEDFDDLSYVMLVAELDETVVGVVVGCSVDESASNGGLIRPPGAGFLAFAAVFPEARGRGVGRALGHALLRWSAREGHPAVAIDWRMTNLLASRAWPRLGFRPTFFRVHRRL